MMMVAVPRVVGAQKEGVRLAIPRYDLVRRGSLSA